MSTLFGAGIEHPDGASLTVIPGAAQRDGILHAQVIVSGYKPAGQAEGDPAGSASIALTLAEVDELIEHLTTARAEAEQYTAEETDRDRWAAEVTAAHQHDGGGCPVDDCWYAAAPQVVDAGHAALALVIPALFAVFLLLLAIANGKLSYLWHHLPLIPPVNGFTVAGLAALGVYVVRRVRRPYPPLSNDPPAVYEIAEWDLDEDEDDAIWLRSLRDGGDRS